MQKDQKVENRDISDITRRGYAAFEAVIQHVPEEGLWDLHMALEKGSFSSENKRARLVRGSWGSVGTDGEEKGNITALYDTACPLNALFNRMSRERGGDLGRTQQLSEFYMRMHGFTAADFYGAWDRGLLEPGKLLGTLDHHITARLMDPKGRTVA